MTDRLKIGTVAQTMNALSAGEYARWILLHLQESADREKAENGE